MNRALSQRGLRIARWAGALTLTLVGGCSPGSSATEEPPLATPDSEPRVFDTIEYQIRVLTVSDDLSYPYSMAFLPDGGLLVTEMAGHVRLIRDGVLRPDPVGVIPEVYHNGASHGLMDVTLHPDFQQNGLVYFTYNRSGDQGTTSALARGTFDGTVLTEVSEIFVADVWAMTEGRQNSRIVFGLDRMLYMTAGGGRSEQDRAQQMSDHSGKVLRLRDDGSVPEDNPFVGRQGYRPEIFSYGHNNIHGIAVHPETGDIWAVEHGDKISILRAGANYGWPFVRYGPSTTPAPNPEPLGVDLVSPYLVWDPDIHISGLAFYTGNPFPDWRGDLFVGGLRTQQVNHVALGQGGPTLRESLFTEIGQWVRDVRQGTDG
jgi:glucose/arabinose dehydrogenase